jgi:hypothetical protein
MKWEFCRNKCCSLICTPHHAPRASNIGRASLENVFGIRDCIPQYISPEILTSPYLSVIKKYFCSVKPEKVGSSSSAYDLAFWRFAACLRLDEYPEIFIVVFSFSKQMPG